VIDDVKVTKAKDDLVVIVRELVEVEGCPPHGDR
jgi:hypothetical protein